MAHLFICLAQATDLAPGDMWTAPLQVAQFLAGPPQFSDLPPLLINFDSFPPLHSCRRLAASSLASCGTTSSSSHLFTSSHFTCGPGCHLPPLLIKLINHNNRGPSLEVHLGQARSPSLDFHLGYVARSSCCSAQQGVNFLGILLGKKSPAPRPPTFSSTNFGLY